MPFGQVHYKHWKVSSSISKVMLFLLWINIINYLLQCLGIPGKEWKEDSVKLIGSTLRNVTDQQLKDKAQVLMKIIIKS